MRLIRLLRCLALLPLALCHVAIAEEQAPAATLLFFLNPDGQPCQIQSQIIDSIRPEIEKRARIVPVSTAVFSDVTRFRQYGIRYLPMLILVDGEQREIKRFPPGIQPAEQILTEIAALGGKT
jgi:thioredoxin 1